MKDLTESKERWRKIVLDKIESLKGYIERCEKTPDEDFNLDLLFRVDENLSEAVNNWEY